MASYRYWRVKATAMHGSSGGFMSCLELRMLTDWDGPQAATGGTAICDSSYPGLPASNAYDGTTNLFASNGSGTNSYIGYDFGTAVELKEVWYTPRNDASYQQIFTAANIDGSNDGSSWTTVQTWTPATWGSGITQGIVVQGSKPADGTAGAGAHAYWRVLSRSLDPSSAGFMACTELTFRTSSGGSQVASGGTPISGTFFTSGNTAAKAYDADSGTYWANAGTGWDWIGYHFSSAQHIVEIAYRARNDGSFGQIWSTAVVQSSDDGVTWTTAASLTASTWSTGSTQTFTVQAAAAVASSRPVVFVCT